MSLPFGSPTTPDSLEMPELGPVPHAACREPDAEALTPAVAPLAATRRNDDGIDAAAAAADTPVAAVRVANVTVGRRAKDGAAGVPPPPPPAAAGDPASPGAASLDLSGTYTADHSLRVDPHRRAGGRRPTASPEGAFAGCGEEEEAAAAAAAAHRAGLLLDGVAFDVPEGALCGILGPSGAGKSTLLDVVAGRLRPNEGFAAVEAGTRVGYVPQTVPRWDMSAEEVLTFYADLRVGGGAEEGVDVPGRVAGVLRETGLRADAACGDAMGSADRKRLALSVALVDRPDVLLLDEPTSGVDSETTAWLVRSFLPSFTEKPVVCAGLRRRRTVLMTIHQPSTPVFNALTHVVLLCRGRVVYAGPNTPGGLAPLFVFPPYRNPAEYLLEEVSVRGRRYLEAVDAAKGHGAVPLLVSATAEEAAAAAAAAAPERRTAGVLYAALTLHRREATQLRNKGKGLFVARAARAVVFGFLMSVFFFRTDETADGVKAKRGIMFLAVLESLQEPLLEAARTQPRDVSCVYDREAAEGLYTPLAFLLGRVPLECAKQGALSLLFCGVCYATAGLRDGFGHFAAFYAAALLLSLSGHAIGLFFAAAMPEGVVLAAGCLTIPLMLFTAGHIVDVVRMTHALRWLCEVSAMRYGYEAVMQGEFAERGLANCSDDGSSGSGGGGGNQTYAAVQLCFSEGDALLQYAMPDATVARAFAALALYPVVFLGLAWVALAVRSRQRML
eukprot:Rhum_TRINITY_DN14549_c13_g1::Rhum_TRINITY_DN14549_c13_g1_i1::g.98817::m.98817